MSKFNFTDTSEACRKELVQWHGQQSQKRSGPDDLALYERVTEVLRRAPDETPESIYNALIRDVGRCKGVDDSQWPTQAEVARGMGLDTKVRGGKKGKSGEMTVKRLCDNGELKTNGKPGKAKRIDLASVLAYCKAKGLKFEYGDADT